MKIDRKTTREQLAAIVVQKLREHNIDAVLVGGAVVSIYTTNKYESIDLDFISSAAHERITAAMLELGFATRGKDFVHPQTEFTVEFPTGPVAIGNDEPVIPEGKIEVGGVQVKLLSPTQSVMDRLISFFVYTDRECLDQAVWIAEKHDINFDQVKAWSKREGYEDKLAVFLKRLGQK